MNKHWSEEELKLADIYFKDGLTFHEIAVLLKRNHRSVESRLHKLGYKNRINKKDTSHITTCKQCNKEFKSLKKDERVFCSKKCFYEFKTIRVYNEINHCINCDKIISNKNTYCNYNCQKEYEHKQIFKKIESNSFLLDNKTTEAKWIKKYLISIKGNKCEKCGWCEVHPITGNIPIEMNHIDGDSDNNNLNNVELLCPNCHSLTHNYGSLNKGMGREKRQLYRLSQKIKNNIPIKEKSEKKDDIFYCKECGKQLSEDVKTGMCQECYRISSRKVIRPSNEQLLNDVKELGYSGTGRKYNVSNTAIKKWLI